LNRRTLSAALQTGSLTEQALDFVKAGSATPTPEAPVAAPVQPAGGREPRREATGLRLPLSEEAEPDAGLIAITVRVPHGVPSALLLASVDRKLKRHRPWTQREIVSEAITHWLKEHGYLS
jgi:hypothetical protein